MPPPRWSTDEQFAFLGTQVNEFVNAQKTGTVGKFWITVEQRWFDLWPEDAADDPTGDKVAGRKKQIHTWFNNLNSKSKASTAPVRMPTFAPTKSRRRFQAIEIFSHEYYKTLVQPVVFDIIKEHGLSKTDVMRVIKECTQVAFDNASDEIKERIDEAFKSQSKPSVKTTDPSIVRTPKDYAAAIEATPAHLRAVLEALHEQSKWSFTVITGGPDPLNEGNIRTIAIHVGKNKLGNSFGQAHPDFPGVFMAPYAMHLRNIYPEDVRRQFIIDATCPPPPLPTEGLHTISEKTEDPEEAGGEHDVAGDSGEELTPSMAWALAQTIDEFGIALDPRLADISRAQIAATTSSASSLGSPPLPSANRLPPSDSEATSAPTAPASLLASHSVVLPGWEATSSTPASPLPSKDAVELMAELPGGFLAGAEATSSTPGPTSPPASPLSSELAAKFIAGLPGGLLSGAGASSAPANPPSFFSSPAPPPDVVPSQAVPQQRSMMEALASLAARVKAHKPPPPKPKAPPKPKEASAPAVDLDTSLAPAPVTKVIAKKAAKSAKVVATKKAPSKKSTKAPAAKSAKQASAAKSAKAAAPKEAEVQEDDAAVDEAVDEGRTRRVRKPAASREALTLAESRTNVAVSTKRKSDDEVARPTKSKRRK